MRSKDIEVRAEKDFQLDLKIFKDSLHYPHDQALQELKSKYLTDLHMWHSYYHDNEMHGLNNQKALAKRKVKICFYILKHKLKVDDKYLPNIKL